MVPAAMRAMYSFGTFRPPDGVGEGVAVGLGVAVGEGVGLGGTVGGGSIDGRM